MKQDSESNSDQKAVNQHLKQHNRPLSQNSWRRKIVTTMIVVLLGSVGGGLIYGWYFVQRKLVPLIETEAGNYLHRPLELGDLKSISLTKASFGNSALPATNDNPDFVKVKEVKINFAPLHFLRQRELKLDLILVQPDIYLEQDRDKLWTPTDFGTDESSSGGIEVDVRSIQLYDGQLSLVAYNLEQESLNPPVVAELDNLIVRPQGNQLRFNAIAELIQGGNFSVTGVGNTDTGVIELDILAQQLNAAEVSNLLALPLEFTQGDLDGELNVTLTEAPIPELNGEVKLDRVALQIPGLVKPFSQSNGKIRFDGSKVELQNIATNFGEVSGKASGSLDLAESGDYQINTKVQSIAAEKVFNALEIDAPVPIEGKIRGDVAVRGNLENPVVSFDLATTTPSRLDKIDFKRIDADLELVGTTLNVKQFTGLPQSGGTIEGKGLLELDETQDLAFEVQTTDVSAKAIARSYDNQLPVEIDRVSSLTNITAQAGDLSTLRLRNGKANFALGNGTVEVDGLGYSQGKWSSQVTASGVEFGSLPIAQGSTETIAQGLVTGQFEVSGTSSGSLNQVEAVGEAQLDTVGGQIIMPQITLSQGNWNADATTENLKLQRLFPELPDEFNDNLSGEFYLAGNIPDDAQTQTLINGFGDLTLAEGTLQVSDLKIVDQDWSAIAQGTNLKLKELSSSTPQQFAGLINGKLKLAGTTDNITPEGIIAQGNGSLTLPEGVLTAEELAIADGQFQAQVTPQQLDLSLFADPNADDVLLTGQLGGKLDVAGAIDNLSPTAVSAWGNLTFSQGIDLLEQPLSAKILWDGKRLDVLQATGDGLNANGYLVLDESFFSDIPDKLAAVEYFEFEVPEARWLDLKKLRLSLPSWANNLDYSGRGDFEGSVSGIPSAIRINGSVGVKNFKVENLDFAPFLTGKVEIAPETGVKLSLQEILRTPLLPATEDFGSESQPLDKIELTLDRNFAPQAFAIAQDYFSIEGTGKSEILSLTARSIPVDLLKTIALKAEEVEVPETLAAQTVNGELSGNFVFNLDTLAASGENIVIKNPTLASIRGDRLEGDFQYANGYFAVQDMEFIQRNSIYQLEGNLRQTPGDIELDGLIKIDGGQIQDILVGLQVFELEDFGRIFKDRAYGDAEDLYQPSLSENQKPLFAAGFEDAPIIDQLDLLAAIQAWLAVQQQERQAAFVPEIGNLRGTFNGQIDVFGSLNKGLTSEFNFLGEKWRWGNLVGQKIVARGNLREGILTLLPIAVELEDIVDRRKSQDEPITPTLLFTGTFGGATQSGQFRLVEVPVELIKQLISLPPELAFDGLINATASIAGTQDNPQARGEIKIDDASLNDTSIQSTKGSFNYSQSRLKFFASSVVAQNADPVTIKGSIPYQLPFAKVAPLSDRLELQLDVKDKGLAILDIFSRGELKWIDGKGEIALDVSGIFDREQNFPRELSTKGVAKIENGTIAAKSLPENSITNINSEVFFDLDNVRVDNFQGDFGEGQISAAGTVPLGDTVPDDPLTVSFNDVKKVELPKLYSGSVKGKLQILGKATEPNISGNLTLFDGTILLANDDSGDESDATAVESNFVDQPEQIARRNTDGGIAALTQYRNLKLELGKNVQIRQPPLFTFTAQGKVNINGSFFNPTPEGTIVLKRGQVNLFTTQLNLSRDYENTARFSNNNVLDPFLDVLLVGSAIEASDRSIASELSPSEIPDSGLRNLETIRISAKVNGLASQITNRLELTSSPSRSPAEIAVLLGGGFVEGLANSSGTAGLATLAGSALFGSLSAEFNNIFPLGEIRLFPTSFVDDDENRDDETDGLAGEIAFELVDNLSFSVLKLLNTDIPAQFGFRYRLDDNFVLRGSSNFEDDGTRGSIEYELRF